MMIPMGTPRHRISAPRGLRAAGALALGLALLGPSREPLPPARGAPSPVAVGLGSRPDRTGLHLGLVDEAEVVLVVRRAERYARGPSKDTGYHGAQHVLHAVGKVQRREVAPARLPAHLRDLPGSQVQVLGADLQPLCRATLGRLQVKGMATYEDPSAPDETGPVSWILVAGLEGMDEACGKGARFARAAALAPLAPRVAEEPTADLRRLAEAQLARTEVYRSAAESARLSGKRLKRLGSPTFKVLTGEGGAPRWLGAQLALDSCELGDVALWALFSISGGPGALRFGRVHADSGTLDQLLLAADVDGDGQVEAITERGQVTGRGYEEHIPSMQAGWPAGLGCDGCDGPSC